MILKSTLQAVQNSWSSIYYIDRPWLLLMFGIFAHTSISDSLRKQALFSKLNWDSWEKFAINTFVKYNLKADNGQTRCLRTLCKYLLVSSSRILTAGEQTQDKACDWISIQYIVGPCLTDHGN